MQTIIAQIITLLLNLVSKEKFNSLVDKLLDLIEDSVTDSSNKIDDAIVLPLCQKARELLNVPDNDDV